MKVRTNSSTTRGVVWSELVAANSLKPLKGEVVGPQNFLRAGVEGKLKFEVQRLQQLLLCLLLNW